MDPAGDNGGVWIRAAVAVAAGGAIAARAVRRKSVDFTAVFAGVPAMVAHTVAGYRFAGLLLVFFFTASRVTRAGEARKRALDPEFKEGGQRNWSAPLLLAGSKSCQTVVSQVSW